MSSSPIYSVTLAQPQYYNVTLGANNNLSVGVAAPTIRPALTYHLDTPSNTTAGIIELVVDVTNAVVDTIPIVGTGAANVTSNGSAIIISAAAAQDIDGGVF